jgi:predicted Zn-dependent protease
MQRSRERLRLGALERPYYVEYRLVDLEVRSVVAQFGAILSSTKSKDRFIAVAVRVGDYKVDSSNFVASDGFQGFIGTTGSVGIDRDYESLRQDLWLSTDQAYKGALDNVAHKRAYLRDLARPTNIDDFSKEPPVVLVQPLPVVDWSARNWEQEAKAASQAFRAFPELQGTRVIYHLLSATQYLMTSEGTEIRSTRTLAAIEAAAEAQADDGRRLHHFFSVYRPRPADLPAPAAVRSEAERISRELLAMRSSGPAPDYSGPVLLEAPAAAALLGQLLGPSISGARPPMAMMRDFERMLEAWGGRSEWTGRLGTRVLPANLSLISDPALKEYSGQPLIGGYEVDDEGVRGQRVTLVENGMLRGFLMSRRPGPEFQQSNGHGRAAFIGEAKPALSNLIVQASDTMAPADLRRKFLEECKAEGRQWCLAVQQMDNPVLGVLRQQEGSEVFSALAGGAANGDRLPLRVSRVYVEDGREEPVHGAWLLRLNLRELRNIIAVGSDFTAFNYHQDARIAGTTLGAFGSAQGGIPSSIVAPSLLVKELEVRGARPGGVRKPAIIPPPPLTTP